MKKKRKPIPRLPKIDRVLPDIFDVPECAYKGVCQIELISDTSVSIEGCGAILAYAEDMVSIRAGKRILQISGEKLTIHGMNENGVVVKGKINGLNFL